MDRNQLPPPHEHPPLWVDPPFCGSTISVAIASIHISGSVFPKIAHASSSSAVSNAITNRKMYQLASLGVAFFFHSSIFSVFLESSFMLTINPLVNSLPLSLKLGSLSGSKSP